VSHRQVRASSRVSDLVGRLRQVHDEPDHGQLHRPRRGPRFLELDGLQDATMQIVRNWQALY